MSRWYEVSVTVAGFNRRRKARIIAACVEEWGFGEDDFTEDGDIPAKRNPVLRATAQERLCGGESEEEFADRLAGAIWKANKDYCAVTIHATYLEQLPCEIHERNQRHYKTWLKEQKGGKKEAVGF